nr:sugar phosphate isomerase/epimerase family protein [Oceaniglobus trochenteri]
MADQARIARELGAMGLELDPMTLGETPHRLSPSRIAEIRAQIEGEGIRVTGMHWLLSGFGEASITDPLRRMATRDILFGLIDLAAELGAGVMVHGSPKQRVPMPRATPARTMDTLAEFFAPVAMAARESGLIYCIEPLSRAETEVINTVDEGADLCRLVGNPAFRTMIDTSAAGQAEPPVADLIARWLPSGMIGHIHLNDTNRGAPGTGNDPFDAILAALARGWTAPMGVEPFALAGTARETFEIAARTVFDLWPGASTPEQQTMKEVT